jgi:hypothetical protein
VQTFKAGDVVQKIADWKKGQQDVTGTLTPEQVMRAALGSTSDLRRVKAVLLTKATPASKAAWRAIQAHGLAELFAKATTRSTNAGGEITEAISGAKLRSALAGDETAKMKVLLDPVDFNRLMKLRRVIEDVTVPISGTVNHSNSGNMIMRLVKDADNQFIAAASAAGFAVGGPVGAMVSGGAARMVAPAIKAAKQAKAEAETLEGVTDYSARRAATDDAGGTEPKPGVGTKAREVGAKSLRGFIDIYSSPRVLAPILVSTEGAARADEPAARRTVMGYERAANPDRSTWDKRADGSAKGMGWLGLLKRPDGEVSSEISVGVEIGGKEREIPLMVPGLTKPELDYLMTHNPESPAFQRDMPPSILAKAEAFARQRIAKGASPFRQDSEQ